MPNTQSAKKALRSSLRKRVFNNLKKVKIKSAYKSLRKTIVAGLTETNAVTSLSQIFSNLDKAVKSNLITRGKADRKKAKAAKLVNKTLTAAK